MHPACRVAVAKGETLNSSDGYIVTEVHTIEDNGQLRWFDNFAIIQRDSIKQFRLIVNKMKLNLVVRTGNCDFAGDRARNGGQTSKQGGRGDRGGQKFTSRASFHFSTARTLCI